MKSIVYYGDPRQNKLDRNETLPAKLDLIMEKLNIRDRVKGEHVVIKLHVGNKIGYSMVHPVFVRKVVMAIKEGGGKPFVADVDWDVEGCAERGYSSETLGCPVIPVGGPNDKYFHSYDHPYKNMKSWHLAGMIKDAGFLFNFAHAKGHPANGYGGALKNLGLGCMVGTTRSQMHDTMHFDRYWFKENCPDADTRQKIINDCPFGALVEDKFDAEEVHIHFDKCNQCGRCLKVAPEGSLKIDKVNFHAFQEAIAISNSIVLNSFAPGKAVHVVLATHMTPVCDCFGFTSMPIMRDAGIFGSDDIVAVDQATLDISGKNPLLEENVPLSMEVHTREGHPLQWLHGPLKDPYKAVEYAEKLGLGTRSYELVDVLPVNEAKGESLTYIPAK